MAEGVTGGGDTSRDPRLRPDDPAGTRPKVDPSSLLPQSPLHGTPPSADVVDGEAVEEGADEALLTGEGEGAGEGDLLPQRRAAGGLGPIAPAAPHQARFHFVYGALAALGAAAVAALIVVLAIGGPSKGSGSLASWSPWKPSQSELAGANQIAGHVGPHYRFAGRQIVSIQASAMDFEGIPLSVAVREPAAQGGDIRIFDSRGFIYRLCGLGPSCSIADGKPSPERLMLLRREALELSLYSFRYLDKADQVVVLLPPPPGERPSKAIFIRRSDVAHELDHPLDDTLARRTPTVRSIRLSRDAGLVDRITGARMFSFSLTQANTANRGFLVLDPVLTSTTQQQVPAQPRKTASKGKQRAKQRGK